MDEWTGPMAPPCASEEFGLPLKSELEDFFGCDLGGVRLHSGPRAAALATVAGARALAFGTDVYLPSGLGRNPSLAERAVLGHEVAHVLQQTRGLGWHDEAAASLEREAVALGRRFSLRRGVPARRRRRSPVGRRLQAHDSFEHRLLGDTPTSVLTAMVSGQSTPEARNAAIYSACDVLAYLIENCLAVNPSVVATKAGFPINMVTLSQSNLMVTYGELNTMADFLTSPAEIDSTPASVLLPILLMTRNSGYDKLSRMISNPPPNPEAGLRFANTVNNFVPGSVSAILETSFLDWLTSNLGPAGRDHYQGSLARNACHFAPYTWWRWQASYAAAVTAAEQAYSGGLQPEGVRQVWLAHGYADHFLQDSFASGHLINKTLVMQWFVEWAAGETFLPVYGWDSIKNLTQGYQPGLSGPQLYSSTYSGLSSDPQTSEEQSSTNARMANTGVVAVPSLGITQQQAYIDYLALLDSTVSQAVTAQLHDLLNGRGVTASSTTESDFVIYGDDAMLNGGAGAGYASAAAQMSQQSIRDILNKGGTDTTWDQIFAQFPNQVQSAGNMISLPEWHYRGGELWQLCTEQVFDSNTTWLVGSSSHVLPDMGVVSVDQPKSNAFSPSWSQPAGFGYLTSTQVAACNFNGDAWYFYVPTGSGTLSAIRVGSDVFAQTNPALPASSTKGPAAAAVVNGQLAVAFVDPSGTVGLLSSPDGAQWTTEDNVAGIAGADPAHGVALGAVGSTVYLFFVTSGSGGSSLGYVVNTGGGWSGPEQVPNSANASFPAVTTDGQSLFLAFQRNQSDVWWGELTGTSWNGPFQRGGVQTQGGVSLTYAGASVQMAYWGTNNNGLYWELYNGNNKWSDTRVRSYTSSSPVSITTNPSGQPRIVFTQLNALFTVDNDALTTSSWEATAYTLGAFVSDTPVALATFGGSTYAFQTLGGFVYLRINDGGGWSAPQAGPGITGVQGRLGIVVRQNPDDTETLWLAATVGGAGVVQVYSYDGTTWTETAPVTAPTGGVGDVAIADYSGSLLVFYESGTAVCWSAFDEDTSAWVSLGAIADTNYPSSTCVTVVDDILYLGFISQNTHQDHQAVFTMGWDGQTWQAPLKEGNDLALSMTLAGYGDKLILLFLGTDNSLHSLWSGSGGTTWSGKTKLGPASVGPGMMTVPTTIGDGTHGAGVLAVSGTFSTYSGQYSQMLTSPGS